MKNQMELKDDVIILKPFSMADAEEHLRGEDTEMQKWLSGGKSTIESVRNFIKHRQELWEKGGPIFCFAIRIKENNKLIGMVELNFDWENIEDLKEGDANIAYGLYPEARRKGYMVRAINLARSFLKEKGIKRAVIRVNPENTNSLKVPTRCGFKKTGKVVAKKEGILIAFIKELA